MRCCKYSNKKRFPVPDLPLIWWLQTKFFKKAMNVTLRVFRDYP
jgi:hypothetical protein